MRSSDHNICYLVWQKCFGFFQEKPVFTFANKAGLDMLETSLVALQDLTLDRIFDEPGKEALFSNIPKLMEQVETPFRLTHTLKCIIFQKSLSWNKLKLCYIAYHFFPCFVFRAMSTCHQACACQEWVGMFLSIRPWLGKCLPRIAMFTAWPSVSSTGPLCDHPTSTAKWRFIFACSRLFCTRSRPENLVVFAKFLAYVNVISLPFHQVPKYKAVWPSGFSCRGIGAILTVGYLGSFQQCKIGSCRASKTALALARFFEMQTKFS